MADKNMFDVETAWELMLPMEQALWATTLAIHSNDLDAGLGAADAAVTRLRSMADIRSRRPEPEYELAQSNTYVEFEEFSVWYPLEYRMRHRRDRDYKEPTAEQIRGAFERYGLSRSDFY